MAELLDLSAEPTLEARYNIAPTQPVPILRTPEVRPVREIEVLHWGLIPSWAQDPAIGARMINARSETAAQKPSFRAAFRYRRCLLPAPGPCRRCQPHSPRLTRRGRSGEDPPTPPGPELSPHQLFSASTKVVT